MTWPTWIGIVWGSVMAALGWYAFVHPEFHIDSFRWWEHRPEWGASRQPLAHDRDRWIMLVRMAGAGQCCLGAIIALASAASALS